MNIAIIGAGNGGTTILKSLSQVPELTINLIIDTNQNAPGILLAKELNIPSSNTFDDINPNNTDMLIEVTGLEKITNMLTEKYGSQCKIIDSKGAYLIMTLVERDIKTLDKLNKQMNSINNTSTIIQEQLADMMTNINNIHKINENLLTNTDTSNKYIAESDKIIKYVNKIAIQTKILGLNANIEAARAGEMGRGFSVVANEIQNMAVESENFASKIRKILNKISDELTKIGTET
ncbi:MAG: methyl-accepting chemotaxis protein, partial [Eubacteriales bacterium]